LRKGDLLGKQETGVHGSERAVRGLGVEQPRKLRSQGVRTKNGKWDESPRWGLPGESGGVYSSQATADQSKNAAGLERILNEKGKNAIR